MSFLGALTRGELLEPATLDMMLSNAFPLAAKSGILAVVTARVRCLSHDPTVARRGFLALLLRALSLNGAVCAVRFGKLVRVPADGEPGPGAVGR